MKSQITLIELFASQPQECAENGGGHRQLTGSPGGSWNPSSRNITKIRYVMLADGGFSFLSVQEATIKVFR